MANRRPAQFQNSSKNKTEPSKTQLFLCPQLAFFFGIQHLHFQKISSLTDANPDALKNKICEK